MTSGDMIRFLDAAAELRAEVRHLRAQVTELQAAGTAEVYRRRGILARCAGHARAPGELDHEAREQWLSGWDEAARTMRGDATSTGEARARGIDADAVRTALCHVLTDLIGGDAFDVAIGHARVELGLEGR